MRSLFLLATAAYAVLLACAAVWFPDQVPLHFGALGEPDRWGSREAALATYAGLGLGFAALLGWIARGTTRWNLAASWLNVPHKEWWTATPERERRVRAMLGRDMWAVAALMMLLLDVVLAGTLRASRMDEPRLAPVTVAALLVLTLALVGYALWVSVGRYRPDRPAGDGESPA